MKIILIIVISLVVLLGALWALESKRRASDDVLYPAPGHFLELDRRTLHVDCQGQSNGVTFMLEAGAGASSLDWDVVFQRLAQHAQVCRYDRAGLGWSDRGPRPRSIAAIVGDLDHVIQQEAGADDVILVGHSFGGLVAQAYARTYPGNIIGLVLVDAVDSDFIELYAEQSKAGARTMRIGSVVTHIGIPRLLGLAPAPSSAPESVQKAMKARIIRPLSIATVADESVSVDANVVFLNELSPIKADLPVIVLSRLTDDSILFDQDWEAAQVRLSQLNARTKRIVSSSSDHQLTFTDPDLVVEAVIALRDNHHQQASELFDQ